MNPHPTLGLLLAGALATTAAGIPAPREVTVVRDDPRVRLEFGEPHLVMKGGLQPSLLGTSAGTLIVQAQTVDAPLPSKRISYPSAIMTVVSRDGGRIWTEFPRPKGENGLNFEGGAVQLRSGRIVALDTYIPPTGDEQYGQGELYVSDDDWRTLRGPEEVLFHLPGVNYHGSSDDYGRAHVAVRLHRRLLELPDGDLLATVYGWFQGDNTPADYLPTMKKTRAFLVRSSDAGHNWRLVGTIAADSSIGTEGFDEPALVRISAGPNADRLRCYLRTGRELYETWSDDEGVTWARPRILDFGVIDIRHTDKWAAMFQGVVERDGRPVNLIGSVVDPDVVELRNGLLVCTVGVRIPARSCWPRAGYPGNGDYLAVSVDHGETWSHVVRLTSGILTTHYTAVTETNQDNQLFVAYDLGDWTSGQGRDIYGRTVSLVYAGGPLRQ
ncbi:MAG: exo-alpha-sialidase [Verrucomicrobia bacterium]|nr:exo-alpha-sialidase [Verrucomicrobiota bacterium]